MTMRKTKCRRIFYPKHTSVRPKIFLSGALAAREFRYDSARIFIVRKYNDIYDMTYHPEVLVMSMENRSDMEKSR